MEAGKAIEEEKTGIRERKFIRRSKHAAKIVQLKKKKLFRREKRGEGEGEKGKKTKT